MKQSIFYSIALIIVAGSCNVGRYLPAGETLYRGATVKVQKQQNVKATTRYLQQQLLVAARPKSNKYLFGKPYQVWWWYFIGQSKKPYGVRAYLRNLLGNPPVLSSRVNTAITAQNMNAYLDNIGYFHSTVKGDTVHEKYFTRAIYTAHIFPQHTIRNITWVNDSTELLKALDDKTPGIIKRGMPYRVNDVDAQRGLFDVKLKSKGYYYFNPNYIMAYADSTIGNYQVDLFFNVRANTPEVARHAYTINRITVFPNYTLVNPPPDTTRTGVFYEDGLGIRDTVHTFKSDLFKRTITYRPGSIYSSAQQNTTLNRFINLGGFKFAKNRFEGVKDTASPYRLNAFYYLTAAKRKSLQAEVDGFSKENKYFGAQASLNWKNRNIFHGSEQLAVKLYGVMELSFNNVVNNNVNYRAGTEAALNLPRYVLPFFHLKDNNLYPSRTQFLVGYEYFIKPSFYTKNIVRLNYEFQWRETPNKQHILSPISFTYINSPNVSDSFYKVAAAKPALLTNVYREIIVSSYYAYTYNTLNPSARNQWYFSTSIEAAGNIAGLLSSAKTPRSKSIFGTPFAQYVKVDLDLRFTKKYDNEVQWVNRFQIGASLPYNNSAFLPLSKQYVIGGSSSLRSYSVRSLGPGSYLPTFSDQGYFQTIGGDYKLLLNSEVRIPIKGRFSAAVFIDIGNIWTKDTVLFGKAGQLKKDFWNELAIASGVGLRVDANLILLRLDIGVPIRKPYLPPGQRLVLDKIDLGNKQWRNDNLNFNFGIGFPF